MIQIGRLPIKLGGLESLLEAHALRAHTTCLTSIESLATTDGSFQRSHSVGHKYSLLLGLKLFSMKFRARKPCLACLYMIITVTCCCELCGL